jgi:purine-nucleoside phosphorylase, family 1 (deoD)
MNKIPTPHISAKEGSFAETVLMPGDPLRAKYIAENFLTDVKLVSAVRNVYAYTGLYNQKPVSVAASGMGMPSMGIYSYELFNFYGVKSIIRVGTCGALIKDVGVRELVVALSASTNSNYAAQYNLPGTYAPTASYCLLKCAETALEKLGLKAKFGVVLSSDTFYDDSDSLLKWGKMGVLAVEMETAALYMNAARAGKNALSILTVSDSPFTGEITSSEEREKTFKDMILVALECL